MCDLTDKIQERLAAEVSLVIVANDVRHKLETGSPESEAEFARLGRLEFTNDECRKIQAAVGNDQAIIRVLGHVATGQIWTIGAHPDMPDLWHVVGWRCPRCKVDAAHLIDEVHYKCAVCGLALDNWERIFDEAGGAW